MSWCDPHALPAHKPQFQQVHMPQPSRLYTPAHSSDHPSSSDNTMFSTAVVNDPSVDHITSLERALCSNFTCCNIHLPDLHALIEHCEENHIPSRTRGSKPVFLGNATRGLALCTPPPSLVTSPSSSRSSSTVSSPMSTSSPLISPIACDHDAHEHTPRCLPPLCSTMYTQILPSDHQYPCGGLADLGLTRDYDFGDCYHVSADPYGDDSLTDALYGDGSIPAYGLHADISFPTTLQSPAVIKKPSGVSKGASRDRPGRSDSTSSNDGSPRKTPKGSSAKARIAGLVNGVGHGRRREKSFRCPTPGCTKTYLNPNGLKYHMEKGTCKIDEPSTPIDAASPDHNPYPSVAPDISGRDSQHTNRDHGVNASRPGSSPHVPTTQYVPPPSNMEVDHS